MYQNCKQLRLFTNYTVPYYKLHAMYQNCKQLCLFTNYTRCIRTVNNCALLQATRDVSEL